MRVQALAIFAIGKASIVTAAAQTYDPAYPVCLQAYGQGGNNIDCSYTSAPSVQRNGIGTLGSALSIHVLCGHKCPRVIAGMRDGGGLRKETHGRESRAAVANTPHQVEHPSGGNTGRKAMKVLAATLILLVSSAAAAQECKSCSEADACIQTYLKAASEAQRATKIATRDWQQNLDKKTSSEFSSRGLAALQSVMVSQVRAELDRLKECLAKIK